jgi:hypothetical protein
MRSLLLVLLFSSGILQAQTNNSGAADQQKPTDSKSQVTLEGCVDRSRGDYILVEFPPGMTYELHATGKIKLRHYMGQQVQVTGTTSTSLITSSDTIAFGVSPAPVAIGVSSIKTLAPQCTARPVGR